MSDNRASTYDEEGERIWRASSFGNCAQNLVRTALGQTPAAYPENIRKAMDFGTDNEIEVLSAMNAYGWKVFDHEDLQNKMNHAGTLDRTGQLVCDLRVPGGYIRCHPDGVVRCFRDKVGSDLVGVEAGLEIKILKEGSWAKPIEKREYAWQVAIERAVLKLPVLFVVAWKEDDPDNEGQTRLIWEDREGVLVPKCTMMLVRDGYSRSDITRRAVMLNKMVRDAEEGRGLPPCDVKQWPCGFYQEHSGGIWDDEVVALEGELEQQARYWGFRWKEAADMVSQWEPRKKEAAKELLRVVTEAGVIEGKASAGPVEMTLVEQVRTSFDKDAARADGVNVAKYETTKVTKYVKPKVKGGE